MLWLKNDILKMKGFFGLPDKISVLFSKDLVLIKKNEIVLSMTSRQKIDDCLCISITSLKAWGYLRADVSNRNFTWSSNGREIARIGYTIHTIQDDMKEMQLKYRYKDEPIAYKIPIVSLPSNLGSGVRWYFVCAFSKKRCMKLICPNGSKHFAHRSAFPNMLYGSQMKTKSERAFYANFGIHVDVIDLQAELMQPYRKTHYKGQPTPLMRKFLRKQQRALNIKTAPFYFDPEG